MLVLDYVAAHGQKKGLSIPTSVRKSTQSLSPRESAADAEEREQRGQQVAAQRAWDVALGPAKGVPMQAFVLWMSGSTVHIVSLVSLFMLASSSVQGLANTRNAFRHLDSHGADISLQMLVYAAGNVALLFLAFYKANSIGLLPTTSSDWLAFLTPREPLQVSDISLQ